ncbi:MAG: hypothetical protein C5S49_05195 [Candidatus Methanogaster sp.]|nr:MAG: hypothetical protein C5S49_05195 [ANME-2 cluster archaeon]
MVKKITVIKTKLSKVSSPEEITEKLSLKKGIKTYPRSYRWREYDLNVIEDLIAKINAVTPQKIDITKLIRGALHLASKQTPKNILEAIFEAEKRSLFSRLP